MRASAANVAVISLVVISIILLFVIIILAAVYGTKATPQYIYIETEDDTDTPQSTISGSRYSRLGKNSKGANSLVLEFEDEEDVRELLDQPDAAMVMVYADWCGFCKKMHPVLDALVNNNDTGVTLAKINANNASGLLTEYKISGYPVLISNFGDKKYIGYKDEPSMRKIMRANRAEHARIQRKLNDVQRRRKHAQVRFETNGAGNGTVGRLVELMEEDVVRDKLQQMDIPTLVMIYAEWCGYCKKMHKVLDALEKYAIDKGIQLYKINYTNAPTLCQEQEIKGFPAMLANFGSQKYSGYMDENQMRDILNNV